MMWTLMRKQAQPVRAKRGTFAIHPDWVSERNSEVSMSLPNRKYKPWAFEYSGARTNSGLETAEGSSGEKPVTVDNFRSFIPPGARKYIRRTETAIPHMLLTPEERDMIHPPAIMNISDGPSKYGVKYSGGIDNSYENRRWGTTVSNPSGNNTNYSYQYATSYSEHFNKNLPYNDGLKGDHQDYTDNPHFAEYYDHMKIPPAQQKPYPSVDEVVGRTHYNNLLLPNINGPNKLFDYHFHRTKPYVTGKVGGIAYTV